MPHFKTSERHFEDRFLPYPSRTLQESTQLPPRLKSRQAKHMFEPGPQQLSVEHFLSHVWFLVAEIRRIISTKNLSCVIIQFFDCA